tara:strand:- start:35431 stop:36678 length:1248 start_codon:yes stop_codon:yes gene_type:complete
LKKKNNRFPFLMIGPGLLLAATGVGGADMATGSIVGSLVGTSILWAVILGALMKFVITEGLARWQIATGETFLEGVRHRFGPFAIWLFIPYLLLWSFFVGLAMMSSCGIALYALFPIFDNPESGKNFFAIISSIIGLFLVMKGGYPLFEKMMRFFVAIMFITVVLTAISIWPNTSDILRGLFIPNVTSLDGESLTWTVALIGGIGASLTVLSYGYWLREEEKVQESNLWSCRVDLGIGWSMTALFGICMVIVGSEVKLEGSGATLLVNLFETLKSSIGEVGSWIFLIGATGTVFSSLLGVWQSVPYLFANSYGLASIKSKKKYNQDIDASSKLYRYFLFALAFVPMIGLFFTYQQIQKIYTITGALFFPFLALALLIMNSRAEWVGEKNKNKTITSLILLGILFFFSFIAFQRFF